ncbi:unnamed protein product [Dovyalis caffra]|uniref:Uncharacterized protein n=1 Tax=Dovyalis caffra TaxID=77055 RepID=A0AAV1R407_9ROSI|nr:unnamed protein product [Dovyalis caffra]
MENIVKEKEAADFDLLTAWIKDEMKEHGNKASNKIRNSFSFGLYAEAYDALARRQRGHAHLPPT